MGQAHGHVRVGVEEGGVLPGIGGSHGAIPRRGEAPRVQNHEAAVVPGGLEGRAVRRVIRVEPDGFPVTGTRSGMLSQQVDLDFTD